MKKPSKKSAGSFWQGSVIVLSFVIFWTSSSLYVASSWTGIPAPQLAQDTKPAQFPVVLTAEQDHKRLLDLLKITKLRPGANPMSTDPSTTPEMKGDFSVITKKLVGHVDNSSFPSIKVDIDLTLSSRLRQMDLYP
jgi:hypothetical protein